MNELERIEARKLQIYREMTADCFLGYFSQVGQPIYMESFSSAGVNYTRIECIAATEAEFEAGANVKICRELEDSTFHEGCVEMAKNS